MDARQQNICDNTSNVIQETCAKKHYATRIY